MVVHAVAVFASASASVLSLFFFQYFILSKIYFRFGLFDVDIHNLISWIHGRINAGEVPIFPLC